MQKGFVAAASDSVAIAQATAAANLSGATVILSASTTDPASVNAIVQSKSISQLTFVGASAAFPASYRNAISSSVTQKNTVLNDSTFERSKALVPAGGSSFVVARAENVAAMNAALSYSVATSSSLLVLSGAEPTNAVRTYLDPIADPAVAAIGAPPGVSDQVNDDDADHYVDLLVDSANASDMTYQAIAQQFVAAKGHAVTKVTSAAGDDLASFALASAVALKQGSVAVPAGAYAGITTDSPAYRFLQLLKDESRAITLVGKGATSAQLTSLSAPSLIARPSSPAWRVLDATVTASTYTLSYTARSGAASYKALNWDDTYMGVSSTTSITLPGTPDFMTLIALDGAGAEIDRLYFRSNEYTSSGGRESVVLGTVRDGTADLRVLGTAGVPRTIVRFSRDPYAGLGDTPAPAEVIAITCKNSFTDTGLNPSLQYTYEVLTMTVRTGTGCGDAAGTPIAGTQVSASAIQLPLTLDPWAGSMRMQEDISTPRISSDGVALPRAGQTMADAARQQISWQEDVALSDGGASRTTAVGTGYVFAYQGYIAAPAAPGLGPTFDPLRPAILFAGSNRPYWWDVNNPDNKFDIRATVQSSSVSTSRYVGPTRKYHCSPVECVLVETKTAPVSELSISSTISSSSTTIKYGTHATNPLQPGAPAIDGDLTLKLTNRAWTLTGAHDKMPTHVFLWGPEFSEFQLAYISHETGIQCLAANIIPGCVAYVNIQL